MSTPKLKARRMWANCYSTDNALYAHPTKQAAIRRSFGQASLNAIPVAVIPLDDRDALVQIARDEVFRGNLRDEDSYTVANRVLTAIGVLPRAKKGRK